MVPRLTIQRHVRQYASAHGINANDDEHTNVTSYSTRVEKIYKHPGSNVWTLTLKRLVEIPFSRKPGSTKVRLRADWWTEEFDGVVVATYGTDSANIPNILGLSEWANAFPERIYHSRNYRTPEKFAGKVRFISQESGSVNSKLIGVPRARMS